MLPEYDEETPRMSDLDEFYEAILDESRAPKLIEVTPIGIFRRYYRPKPQPRAITT